MPRNGSGVYSEPPGTTAVPNSTILSTPYNALVADLVADANAARPVTAGGTGQVTLIGAIDAWSPNWVNVASATTTDIGAASSPNVNITGTTTITGLGTKTAGVIRRVKFAGALTLTHNGTSLILPGAANITTAAGDTAVFVSEGSGNWRCLSYQRANATPLSPVTRGHIYGLTLSNNSTDATNDIDIAAGEAASIDSAPVLIKLASALTKRFDATWAVGTGNGGRFSASSADGWYYLWLIRRPDTGVVDAGFSSSKADPTPDANYPADYTQRRYIGAVYRTGSAFKGFFQNADDFSFSGPGLSEGATIACSLSSTTQGVTLPSDVWGKFRIRLSNGTTSTNLVIADAGSSISLNTNEASLSAAASGNGAGEFTKWVGSSPQITHRASNTTGSPTFSLITFGWIDDRGKNG